MNARDSLYPVICSSSSDTCELWGHKDVQGILSKETKNLDLVKPDIQNKSGLSTEQGPPQGQMDSQKPDGGPPEALGCCGGGSQCPAWTQGCGRGKEWAATPGL